MRTNKKLYYKLIVVALLMFGFGFALVPLYKAICDETEVNSLTKKSQMRLTGDEVKNLQVDETRNISILFDATSVGKISILPQSRSLKIHPGGLYQMEYELRNNTNQILVGQAIPSYLPAVAQRYFKKLECFCFEQQTLKPREVKRFPVQFVIDNELSKDISEITLSYTFSTVLSPR